eukprot:TRINITY_DN14347_c1_g2_i1.p3 TRINITY_DN14347_c1_g2~~TRINITY_DN14347_c1_g2_i1.p3  ORF type:complete len:287 (+),score=28.08 TRINITY_DN14347_c1_g2_i1:177-1037(+)
MNILQHLQHFQKFLLKSKPTSPIESQQFDRLICFNQRRWFAKAKKKNIKKPAVKRRIVNVGQFKWKWDTTVRNATVPMPNERLPRKPHLPHIYKANTPFPYFYWQKEGYQTEELIDRINHVEQQRRAGTSSLCLTHLYRTTDEGELLRKGLTCARSGYITRVRQKLFNWELYVSEELIKKSVELDAGDVGMEALERSWYYGFKPDLNQHQILMQRAFDNKDLGSVIRIYNALKINQVQPGDKIAEMLTEILISVGKQKAASDVVKEFEANGFQIAEDTKQKVQNAQ